MNKEIKTLNEEIKFLRRFRKHIFIIHGWVVGKFKSSDLQMIDEMIRLVDYLINEKMENKDKN